MPLSRPFHKIVIERGVKDDEFYKGLIESCKELIDEKEFKAAYIALEDLICIQENRKMIMAG